MGSVFSVPQFVVFNGSSISPVFVQASLCKSFKSCTAQRASRTLVMASNAASLASGVIFGSALTLSNVAAPSVIINQLKFTDYHMLLTFLTASACSTVVFAAAKRAGLVHIACKKDSSYGWLGRYDGNIVGGALMGAGMGLTGACPGTVLVQAALGVSGSRALLLSGLLGGIAFVKWNQRNKQLAADKSAKHSVSEATGLRDSNTMLVLEAALWSMILAANAFAPRGHYLLHPVVGGVLIGLAQVSSVAFVKRPIGVSTAYEDLGKFFWSCVEGKPPAPGVENMIFVGGLVAGAKLVAYAVPEILESFSPERSISFPAALVGGFALMFGARLAGGCTSGHGLSG